MQFRSTIVWRGIGYGAGASALPFSIITVIAACKALAVAIVGAEALALNTLAIGLGALAFGVALGILPGLAVGVAVARRGTEPRSAPPRQLAAIAAAATFFAETVGLTMATGGPVGVILALLGTPVAGLMAAVLAKHVQGQHGSTATLSTAVDRTRPQ